MKGEPNMVVTVVIPATLPSRKQNSTMRPFAQLIVISAAAFLAGCASTPEARIARNQAAFNEYPAAVQQQIRSGEVALGFTPAMVRLALGEPSRVFSHQADTGLTELWVYHDNGPHFSIGIGLGGAVGRHSSAGVGMSTSTGDYDSEEKMRVEFRDGKVTAIEYVKR